jgi:uncharacterized protein YuzE
MIIDYDAETDSLYITLVERLSVESCEIATDVIADYDEAGRLVGLDVQHAKENVGCRRST